MDIRKPTHGVKLNLSIYPPPHTHTENVLFYVNFQWWRENVVYDNAFLSPRWRMFPSTEVIGNVKKSADALKGGGGPVASVSKVS